MFKKSEEQEMKKRIKTKKIARDKKYFEKEKLKIN